ncbi:MAG: NAD(+) diphosphatase [Clostridiales bacterium]|nr:NAD(+) diphosphatase [Clostridiales bacterium]
MIQDIFPSVYDNTYTPKRPPMPNDYLLLFHGPMIYSRVGENAALPIFADFTGDVSAAFPLFSIDGRYVYFARVGDVAPPEGYEQHHAGELMHVLSRPLNFAAITAYHLAGWYADNRYCGRCGHELERGETERSLVCPDCGNIVYPKISPVIIVCVTDGDRMLLTKYAGRDYTNYALIAGFCEIGERPEDTVRREVMEETGVRVKNIRYYGSQPWGLSSSMLLGFFAELDGSAEITVDRSELSEAGWFRRGEVFLEDDGISLTRDMILHFINSRE